MPLWRPAANNDRKNIIAFIAKDSSKAEIESGDLFIQKTAQLDQYLMPGRIGRVKGTRELVAHPNYLLIYRVQRHVVDILRVKHTVQFCPI